MQRFWYMEVNHLKLNLPVFLTSKCKLKNEVYFNKFVSVNVRSQLALLRLQACTNLILIKKVNIQFARSLSVNHYIVMILRNVFK